MQGFVAFPVEAVLVLDFAPGEDELWAAGERGWLPEGRDEVGDGEVFFPGEKPVEGTVLDGDLDGGACLVSARDGGVDGGKVLVGELGEVVGVELVRHGSAAECEMQVVRLSFPLSARSRHGRASMSPPCSSPPFSPSSPPSSPSSSSARPPSPSLPPSSSPVPPTPQPATSRSPLPVPLPPSPSQPPPPSLSPATVAGRPHSINASPQPPIPPTPTPLRPLPSP